MKERPILFSGPMVRAILDGRKTVTRRIVGLDTLKPSETPGYDWTFRGQAPVRTIAGQRRHAGGCWQDLKAAKLMALCPHGAPGDRLWVRETWASPHTFDSAAPREIPRGATVHYAATADLGGPAGLGGLLGRPSIFMPRWASRITLDVTAVHVERLQAITEADAIAEGCEVDGDHAHARDNFVALWDGLNADLAPWASNPWVWVVSFAVAEVRK